MNFNNLRELNLAAVTERANEKLEHLLKLVISNEDMVQIAKAQQHASNENLDMWESLSWHIVELELIERQVRTEDETCESNSKHSHFNGGF